MFLPLLSFFHPSAPPQCGVHSPLARLAHCCVGGFAASKMHSSRKKEKKMGQRKQTCLLRHCNQHFRWSLQTKCPFFSYFLKFISLYWFVGFMFTETMQTYHIWSSLRSWVILSFGHVSLEVMADWFAWIVADFCECLLIVDWPCDGEFSLVQCEQCWPYIVLILTD